MENAGLGMTLKPVVDVISIVNINFDIRLFIGVLILFP